MLQVDTDHKLNCDSRAGRTRYRFAPRTADVMQSLRQQEHYQKRFWVVNYVKHLANLQIHTFWVNVVQRVLPSPMCLSHCRSIQSQAISTVQAHVGDEKTSNRTGRCCFTVCRSPCRCLVLLLASKLGKGIQ